jgi:hypothetical protein
MSKKKQSKDTPQQRIVTTVKVYPPPVLPARTVLVTVTEEVLPPVIATIRMVLNDKA